MLGALLCRDPGVQHPPQGQFEHGDRWWASSIRVHKEVLGKPWANSELATGGRAHMHPCKGHSEHLLKEGSTPNSLVGQEDRPAGAGHSHTSVSHTGFQS